MNNNDRNLLFKDLCGRLPYSVLVKSKKYSFPIELRYLTLDKLPDVKPYLRPMSAMTQEEKKTYNSFINHFEGNNLPNYEGDFVYVNESHELADWLNASHLDYRGLIPMGLAIEAPEGMYDAFTDTSTQSSNNCNKIVMDL